MALWSSTWQAVCVANMLPMENGTAGLNVIHLSVDGKCGCQLVDWEAGA